MTECRMFFIHYFYNQVHFCGPLRPLGAPLRTGLGYDTRIIITRKNMVTVRLLAAINELYKT